MSSLRAYVKPNSSDIVGDGRARRDIRVGPTNLRNGRNWDGKPHGQRPEVRLNRGVIPAGVVGFTKIAILDGYNRLRAL
jgi:hypothetical protein